MRGQVDPQLGVAFPGPGDLAPQPEAAGAPARVGRRNHQDTGLADESQMAVLQGRNDRMRLEGPQGNLAPAPPALLGPLRRSQKAQLGRQRSRAALQAQERGQPVEPQALQRQLPFHTVGVAQGREPQAAARAGKDQGVKGVQAVQPAPGDRRGQGQLAPQPSQAQQVDSTGHRLAAV